MSSPTPAPAQVTTFYSYKGGTGRTMLVANVAWILASAGKRVLAIDWDLEAPGLHHYLHPFLIDPQLQHTDGLIDMMFQYSRDAVTPEEHSSGTGWLDRAADVTRFVAGVNWNFPNNGQLHILPAGRQNAAFSIRVNTFNWLDFYERLNGGAFLELVKRKIKFECGYDHVLIDSRTGVSDTSGICTVQMPDRLVICFTASEQSIVGSAAVAASALTQWARLQAASSDRPADAPIQRVLPVLMRIEASEKEKLDAARAHVRAVFGKLPGLSANDERYWSKAEVLYWPFYAFEETLAVFADVYRSESSLLKSCENVADLITDGSVKRLTPPESEQRQEALAAYQRRGAEKSGEAITEASQARRVINAQRRIEVGKRLQSGSRRWFLSFNQVDRMMAERLVAAIQAKDPGARVFYAPQSLQAGGFWLPDLAREIAEADGFILLIGQNGPSQWQTVEYFEALDRRIKDRSGFPMIAILLEGQPAPGLPFLRQLHWIITPDPASERDVVRIFDALSGGGSSPSELWRYTSPYRGLEPMNEKDSDYFFGRASETIDALSHLARQPAGLVVLIGNSGVGKSSLAQAGVLAAFMRQAWPESGESTVRPDAWPAAFEKSRQWCYLTVKPGTEPVKALVGAFLSLWQFDPTDPKRVSQQHGWIDLLRDGRTGLGDLIEATERRLVDLGQTKPPAFFILIDHGEELYVRAEQDQQRCFSKLLAAAVADSRLRALMTLRSDFLGELQRDQSLFAVHRLIHVPPMREEQLREVISRPAALLDARFESAHLAEDIARVAAAESVQDAGALPLLSYLLDDMWSQMLHRGDGILRLPAHGIELGGVLADRANRFLGTHPGSEAALRRVLTLRLATVREDGEPTRRRAARAEFTDEEWRLVSDLADYPNRLLVTAVTELGEAYAEVAHEAVFRRWAKLREWIAAEREFLAWRASLEAARRTWSTTPESLKRQALLMGLPLIQAKGWIAKRAEDIPTPDKEFINLSIRGSTWYGRLLH